MQYNQSGCTRLYKKQEGIQHLERLHRSLSNPGSADIDEEAIIDADKEGFDWASPTDWHYEDGSIAEGDIEAAQAYCLLTLRLRPMLPSILHSSSARCVLCNRWSTKAVRKYNPATNANIGLYLYFLRNS